MSRNININQTEKGNVDVNVNVNVKKEIAGIYDIIGTRKDYMPEFRIFAVALSKKIGKKEAAAELGLRDTYISKWMGDIEHQKWADKRRKDKDNDFALEQREKIKALQDENNKLRQHISNHLFASILQN